MKTSPAEIDAALRDHVLETRKYPTITFKSRAVKAIAREDGTFDVTVAGELDLHGVRREVTVPVTLAFQGDSLRASGTLQLRQRDFKIAPFSFAGGTVTVADRVTLSFTIVARRRSTGGPPTAVNAQCLRAPRPAADNPCAFGRLDPGENRSARESHRLRLMTSSTMSSKGGAAIDLGWSAPAKRVDAGTARQSILSQHEHLRALLDRASAVAEAALDGRPPSPDAVASAVGDIRTTFEVHLTFEEKVLLPLLRDDLPLGPERADRLLDEHARQRQTLATLHREACAFPAFPTLAAKLAFLTSWLLADMAEEEHSLLTPDVVRDDVVVIDQSSG